MRDSILRVIDDLETKKAREGVRAKRASIRTAENLEHMMCSGIAEGLNYAIQELQKVLDENPKV